MNTGPTIPAIQTRVCLRVGLVSGDVLLVCAIGPIPWFRGMFSSEFRSQVDLSILKYNLISCSFPGGYIFIIDC